MDKNVEEKTPKFLINLNDRAKEGKLDPVIGRIKEIRSVIEILGRRSKNNPVLEGEAGVGKTAIVEGLAEQIVKGQVPDVLKKKIVYSLDMGALMAGTKFRGEFEERIQQLLAFVKESAGESILFIDEIHQLVGAGKTEGAMDGANLLKPALARGELHCIGATTPQEYQKYILQDPALERRFCNVPVREPSKEDTIEILMGIRDKYEIHHGIKISDDAIYGAVFLSDQYITNKHLPDKAIDLIDQAASALKLSAESMPADLLELESEIRSKRIYAQVEKNNKEIAQQIEVMQADFDRQKEIWAAKVRAVKNITALKAKLDRAKFMLEQAELSQNYEEASRIKYSTIPEIEKELGNTAHDWVLGKEHIALVISRQLGIPIEKILKTKQENILQLEDFLNEAIYGQEESIKEIAETLISSYAGLSSIHRPLGSFLLLGPTGVGKTETAKKLAKFLFESEDNMIRLDMSEYSERHSVAKLIGSPAGYVGYDDGGVLTEAVRKRPYSVILFDEVEKAHIDFTDIMLQILDDGRLTDNKGRTINFKNSIIIMTSNSKDLQSDFRPELLGRIDAILRYSNLSNLVMRKLVEKQLRELNSHLRGKNIEVELEDSAYHLLEERGYDATYGARPLAIVFNKFIVRPLAKMIVSGEDLSQKIIVRWIDGTMQLTSK
ncbi:MAG: hypothetical protein A2504_11315 [Bdellovibrionales bacterium RIFOXYD12_FULL_39_22]|nr:MAG: hypothetical protein A2385_09880 [Bdellovibrionales bacterium RIFOXYB1_FULL_39_21]OFZ44260.1 MAG: hypothetical protein A2485_07500 [Bdellovibrionales bacterium RIFOXYC12_FULL_39_17]OFZ46802.1 MAG: hypothetical protein A2404_04735 [Bdellovibrionales bacterium RIFOXYC1_FULL_39_130]OFZ75921.1 MAG: hypothetical protein A2560_02415 [Bdellovibrionales bacterium RIFOXYD1_FULL_39_84]OFZ95481.1 MAG: hypothetical protein A2504_11315 [Bdellovibrionales bacterium RIFOXYD12_FULL_39_22]HLE09780.1 AA